MVFLSETSLLSYLNNVINKTRVLSWNIPKNTILELIFQKGFPLKGIELVEILLHAYRNKYKPGAKLIIYKACPFMPWHIIESTSSFPSAKYIHIIRDPRAVYHSQKTSINPFLGKPYSSSPLKTAMEWEKAIETTNYNNHQHKILQIKFENIVKSPNKSLENIIQFFSVSTKKDLKSSTTFTDRMVPKDKNLHKKINEKPDTEKIFNWKNNLNNEEIKKIDFYLNKLLIANNYEVLVPKKLIPWYDIIFININIKKELIILFFIRIKRLIIRMFFNPKYLLTQIKLKFNGSFAKD